MLLIAIFLVCVLLYKPVTKFFKKPLQPDDAYQFDDFVCNDFFVAENFKIKPLLNDSRQTISEEESYLLPDFRFIQISNSYEFYVKTKYFSDLSLEHFTWCDEQQFLHYKFLKELPLYIVIGHDRTPYFPKSFYIIPFNQITSHILNNDLLSSFKIDSRKPVIF